MDNILNTNQTVLTKAGSDDVIGAQRDTLTTDFTRTTLVDEFSNRLQIWVSVSDEWLHKTQHLDGGGVDTDENTIVNLTKSQKAQYFLDLWRNTNNTSHSNYKHNFFLRWDEILIGSLSLASIVNQLTGSLIENK